MYTLTLRSAHPYPQLTIPTCISFTELLPLMINWNKEEEELHYEYGISAKSDNMRAIPAK